MQKKDERRRSSRKGRPRVLFHVLALGKERRRGLALLLLLAVVAGTAWYFVEDGVKQKGELFFVGRWFRDVTETSGDDTPRTVEVEPSLTGAESDDVAVPALSEVVVAVEAEPIPTPSRVHPFDVLRMERERQRSREIELLETIIGDPTRPPDEREAAARRVEAMWADARREVEIEHLLEAQGYRVVATVSEDRAHIVVDTALDGTSAARIGELTVQVTGVGREGVTIVDSISSGG